MSIVTGRQFALPKAKRMTAVAGYDQPPRRRKKGAAQRYPPQGVAGRVGEAQAGGIVIGVSTTDVQSELVEGIDLKVSSGSVAAYFQHVSKHWHGAASTPHATKWLEVATQLSQISWETGAGRPALRQVDLAVIAKRLYGSAAAECQESQFTFKLEDELDLESTDKWFLEPEAILERLESSATPFQERLTAVFVAETTGFSDEQRPRLVRTLFGFCEAHRFTDNEELETAVGSAVRKLALNMTPTDFEEYAELFAPTDTDTLSCVIELELAKAVSWRLEKLTSPSPGTFPRLESRLTDLASDYLTPRLILQKNYASIVIHAVIAMILLNAGEQEQFVGRIVDLDMEWHRDLFERRVREVAARHDAIDSSSGETILHLCDLLSTRVSET